MADGFHEAKGHVCKIWLFDTATAVVPFTHEELDRLKQCVELSERTIPDLTPSEKALFERLKANLLTAMVALEMQKR
jgi:hypothetical protein